MISFRKFSSFLTALALMAYALPGMAASTTKYFYAAFPSFIVKEATQPQTIYVTFYNTSPPPGLSTANSILITPPQDAGVEIVGVSPGNANAYNDGLGSWVINNIPGIKRGASLTFAITANVTKDCVNGTWGAAANTGNSYPQGDPFSNVDTSQLVSSCDGAVACNATGTPFAFLDQGVIGLRGKYNKDGSPCIKVAYDFTSDIALDNTVHLAWDTGAQPFAAFIYSIDWNPVPITSEATLGWPSKRPNVAWKEKADFTPDWIPALACVGEAYPVPYGTVAGSTIPLALTNATTTFAITTTGSLPLPGTTILVESERMLVTNATSSPNTLTVLRGQDGTTALSHDAGTFVTGTPVLLPTPLVELAANIGGLATDVSVPVKALPSTFPTTVPPPVPFPAIINTERILVTAVSTAPCTATSPSGSACWTVLRGQGGTTVAPHVTTTPASPTPFTTYVMSTPLPLVPNTTPFDRSGAGGYDYRTKQAQMCVAEHGFVPAGMNSSGVTLIQYYTTVVDIGDGYVGIE